MHSCELFRGYNDEQLEKAKAFFNATVKSYKKGEFLHMAGEKMQKFGLVLDGIVQVNTDDINGERMMMANVTSGHTFGESLCWLKVDESPVYIVAASDCSIMWLSVDNLYYVNNDAFAQELSSRFISMLARRTLTMNDRIQILSKSSIRAKLVAYFTKFAGENGGKTFTVNLDRQDMAVYLGTDRSALSRELGRMKREGLIDYKKNKFRILKPIE